MNCHRAGAAARGATRTRRRRGRNGAPTSFAARRGIIACVCSGAVVPYSGVHPGRPGFAICPSIREDDRIWKLATCHIHWNTDTPDETRNGLELRVLGLKQGVSLTQPVSSALEWQSGSVRPSRYRWRGQPRHRSCSETRRAASGTRDSRRFPSLHSCERGPPQAKAAAAARRVEAEMSGDVPVRRISWSRETFPCAMRFRERVASASK